MSSWTPFGVYLVINQFWDAAADTSPLCQILEQSDKWHFKVWGYKLSLQTPFRCLSSHCQICGSCF